MEKQDNKAIISKFMNKQIEVIYKKYLNVSDHEEELVASFIRKLDEAKMDFFDPYLDYKNTKELAEELEDEEDIDVIKLYIFLKSDFGLTVDVEEIGDYHQQLEEIGFIQIQDYLLYYYFAENQLEAIVEEALVYDLEEPDRAADLFSADELAEMWICGISLEEAAGQLVEEYGWQEVIDMDYLGTSYFDKQNHEVFCCETDGGGLFD